MFRFLSAVDPNSLIRVHKKIKHIFVWLLWLIIKKFITIPFTITVIVLDKLYMKNLILRSRRCTNVLFEITRFYFFESVQLFHWHNQIQNQCSKCKQEISKTFEFWVSSLSFEFFKFSQDCAIKLNDDSFAINICILRATAQVWFGKHEIISDIIKNHPAAFQIRSKLWRFL